MNSEVLMWCGFGMLVVTMLVLDLGVFHRKGHEISLREASVWTVVWVGLALAFNGVIYALQGSKPALEFLTGYVLEKSLSVDNVFVFAMVFKCFGIPGACQHRVLFWGILGAIMTRLVFILAGVALLERFDWIVYVFGAIVLVAGIKLFRHNPCADFNPERNVVLRLARRFLRVTPSPVGERFVVRQNGVLLATPLLMVLLVVEATDIMFAVDSIPAILAITQDPFIVFTSNIFAILGLRALYFLLAGVMGMFRYLDRGLAVILCFIGVKMLTAQLFHIPVVVSLSVVLGILAVSVLVSVAAGKRDGLGTQGACLPGTPSEPRQVTDADAEVAS